jgi:hypothetical protein
MGVKTRSTFPHDALASQGFDEGPTDMLHAISLAVLTILAAPSPAPRESGLTILTQQQQQPPQAAPKRDCERKRDEGVSV